MRERPAKSMSSISRTFSPIDQALLRQLRAKASKSSAEEMVIILPSFSPAEPSAYPMTSCPSAPETLSIPSPSASSSCPSAKTAAGNRENMTESAQSTAIRTKSGCRLFFMALRLLFL